MDNWIAKGRKAQNKTQQELADALCVPLDVVRDYEDGKYEPNEGMMRKIQNVFIMWERA